MTDLIPLLIVGIVVLLVIVAWLAVARRRSEELRARFGREYDRAVVEAGSRRAAEADLADRARRVDELEIAPLDPGVRQGFATRWRELQGRFVDDPKDAIKGADRLIGEVLEARGYPMVDFHRRVDDISVEHGDVVEHYRIAHDIARRADGAAPVDTEDLRQALVHYRALFTSLLGEREDDRLPDETQPAAEPGPLARTDITADEVVTRRTS